MGIEQLIDSSYKAMIVKLRKLRNRLGDRSCAGDFWHRARLKQTSGNAWIKLHQHWFSTGSSPVLALDFDVPKPHRRPVPQIRPFVARITTFESRKYTDPIGLIERDKTPVTPNLPVVASDVVEAAS